jgi:hypothetical protein
MNPNEIEQRPTRTQERPIRRLPNARLVRLRSAARGIYWSFVEKVNRLAYLRHLLEDSGQEYIESDIDIEIYEEIQAMETRIWTKRGSDVHTDVTDLVDIAEHEEVWQESSKGQYIERDTLRKFKKLVEDAEYERSKRRREGRESWIKWITAGAAIIAALGTLLSLYLASRGKKP